MGRRQGVSAIGRRSVRSRSGVARKSVLPENAIHLPEDPKQYMLLPAVSRRRYKLLLRRQTDFEQASEQSPFNAYTDARLERPALMEDVGQVRVKGYAFTKHSFTEGLGVIAMTLPAAVNGRTMALGVAGYVNRLERKEEEIVSLLRRVGSNLAVSGLGEAH